MRCVPESVNKLFHDVDLSEFKARSNGYGLGDIQRMIPDDYTVWPLYVNHTKKAENHDILKVIPKTENKIPLFLLSDKHCVFSVWSRSEIIILDGDNINKYDADEYFRRNKIYQIAGIVNYENYNLLTLKP